MIHFSFLEKLGLRCAVMSSREDGDCGWNGIAGGSRQRFCARVGVPANALVATCQVHGDTVMAVDATQSGAGAWGPESAPGRADALITRSSDLPLGIAIADCVPVLFYAPDHGVAGIAHAGREGTVRHISAATVRAMKHHFQTPPEAVYAVIGPSAGPCCYEVDAERAAAFARACDMPQQGRYLDLWEANRKQLCAAGVPTTHIQVAKVCTICSNDYFSYRNGDLKARNLAVVML